MYPGPAPVQLDNRAKCTEIQLKTQTLLKKGAEKNHDQQQKISSAKNVVGAEWAAGLALKDPNVRILRAYDTNGKGDPARDLPVPNLRLLI
jgi:hypothetical protein